MKSAAFAIALLVSGAAVAQTYPSTTTDTTMPVTTDRRRAARSQMPSNADPEHDARGIAVISDPAAVPAGFNGSVGAGRRRPADRAGDGRRFDRAATAAYPACSRTVTDNCVQTYERRPQPAITQRAFRPPPDPLLRASVRPE